MPDEREARPYLTSIQQPVFNDLSPDSDDEEEDVQVHASWSSSYDKVVEEHMQAVQEVQLQHLDEDDDIPGLVS